MACAENLVVERNEVFSADQQADRARQISAHCPGQRSLGRGGLALRRGCGL